MNRGWNFVVLLLMPFLLCNCVCGQSTEAGEQAIGWDADLNWPGFLGANRDSKSKETGILKDWSSGKLKTVWQADVGEGYVLGAVANGRFFQFDALKNECRLICRDAATGKEKWTFQYAFEYKDMYQFSEGPRATPIVDGDKVYIYGVAGMLHCLNCDDGKVVWKSDVNKSFDVVQNFFGVGSTPIIRGDSLIVMVGGSPENERERVGQQLDEVQSNGTAIVVFDKTTGEIKHKLGNDLASYSSVQLYENRGGVFGVAWMRGTAIGFDFENGKELWSFPYRAKRYESVNASTPVVRGTNVFLSESYGLGSLLLDVANNEPKVIWQDKNPRDTALATHWNTPVLHDGNLYACHGAGQARAELRCIDFETGKTQWRKKGFSLSSFTFVDEHLIVLDENGELALIKATPESFTEVTRYSDADGQKLPLKRPCWAAPVISNGLLYIRGKKKLMCLRLIEMKTQPK